MATKEQPQVTVRGIPQNQYNDNVAATTQQPGDDPNQGGGIEGHFKKHWVIYTLGIGLAGILVILWLNHNSNSSTAGTDTYGYGTGNSYPNGEPSDLYGSQLDADYQQMINNSNITNSLLQQLLGAGTSGSTTGGTSGSGSSSGSSGGHKKPPKGTKGGSKGSSSGNHKKSTSGGTGTKVGVHGSGSTSSSHSQGTSHSNGKTTISHNSGGSYGKQKNYTTKNGTYVVTGPGAKPANARWVSVPKGTSTASLQAKYFPGSNTQNPKTGNILAYGKNYNIFKGNLDSKARTTKNLRIQV